MTGIEAYAVALPRLVLRGEALAALGPTRRLEARRVPDHDEDEATLAVAAARKLQALGAPAPSALVTASERAPAFGALVAEAMGLGGARVAELRGPTSGLAALLAARDAVAQGHGAALAVSADAPPLPGDEGEPECGAAATAWLVTAKGAVQVRREASASLPDPAPAAERAKEALAQALASLTRAGLSADSVARVAAQDDEPSLLAVARDAFPKASLARAAAQVGDAGATAPLLALARALEEGQAGETIVLAAAGAGLALACSLEVERKPKAAMLAVALAEPSEALDFARYARLRGWGRAPGPDVSQGAAVSASQWLETLPARLRFEGQRCQACGKVQFPPRAACLACNATRLEAVRLSGRGSVHSIATIGAGSAPAEFAEQQRRAGAYDVAIVELEEGPRCAAMVCDAAPGALRIGDAVELVVRRLYTQDGAPRYGFKARPAHAAGQPSGAGQGSRGTGGAVARASSHAVQ